MPASEGVLSSASGRPDSVVAARPILPISYRFDSKSGFTIVTCTGVLTADDIRAHWDEVYTDAQVLDGGRILVDMRKAEVEISKAEFVKLATEEWPAEATSGLKMAVVVNTPEQFDAARQFQLLARDDSAHQVFFNVTDARAWLSRQHD